VNAVIKITLVLSTGGLSNNQYNEPRILAEYKSGQAQVTILVVAE